MKNIFTLLFCVAATAFAASANNDAQIERCINHLLGDDANVTMLQAQNMDVNHDGVINITDVTTLINQNIQKKQAKAAKRELEPMQRIPTSKRANQPTTSSHQEASAANEE